VTVRKEKTNVAHTRSCNQQSIPERLKNLKRSMTRTQCPFCRQYITTDVTTKAGSAAYIVCLISILFCCIAGCCVIPFCMDRCKDVVHKCPKCRSHIKTCKKL
uniref:LITAF domain-containing protein n=1 Tax=Sinocyclocheilus anshuiensis TaxID=1608454 RepID=A0A671SEA9_9TELE